MLNCATRWYVLRVEPKSEFSTERQLKQGGFEAFVPIEHKWKRRSRYSKRKYLAAYPAFLGYVFVGLGSGAAWPDLSQAKTIRGVLTIDGRPASLTSAEVQRLCELSGASVPYQSAVNPHRAIRPGEAARIVEGPFSGRTITVKAIVAQKARTIMELFGARRAIEIPLAALDVA